MKRFRAQAGSVVAGLLLSATVLMCVLVGCERREAGAAGKPTIVVSIYPVANLVEQIVGDRAEVVCMVPPGISPHGFEPTARQMEAVQRAEMIVMVGLRFDDWARDAKQRFGRADAELLVFAESLADDGHDDAHTHDNDHDHDEDHADEHDDDHDHDHSGENPHVWLDPVLTRDFVERLGPALAQRLGDADGEISRRTAALAAELGELDEQFREALGPYRGEQVITFHNAFDRMVERYGLEVAATLTPIESPGALTPGRIERVLDVITEHEVRTVFAEPQFPPDAGRVLQREAGVQVLMLDPLGDPNDPQRSSYQKMMRSNLETLVAGLRSDS